MNNAGIFQDENSRLIDLDENTFEKTLRTKFIGAYNLTKGLLPKMEERGFGRVMVVSSGLGQISTMGAGNGSYRISKAAMIAATLIISAEVKHPNVKINSVCPDWVRTDMGGVSAGRSVEQGAETIVWAVTLAEEGPNGGFFRDKERIDW